MHRGPDASGSVGIPSGKALILTIWLIACALAASAAIDGARSFQSPQSIAASVPAEHNDSSQQTGTPDVAESEEHTLQPTPAEQRRITEWEEYIADLADKPGRESPAASASPVRRDGPGGDDGRSGQEAPSTQPDSRSESRPAPLPQPGPQPERPEEPAPAEPPRQDAPGGASLLDGLLAPVSDLVGDVLGLLSGASAA